MQRWFAHKLVVLDGQPSGEEVVRRVCEATPPGYLNRIMGMQNIKGVGMEFVLRWQAWQQCFQACQGLNDPRPEVAQKSLQALLEFPDFGLLGTEHVRSAVKSAQRSPVFFREPYRAHIEAIRGQLNAAAERSLGPQVTSRGQGSGLVEFCLQLAERFMDVTDVVLRRHRAHRIYRDLAHERISRRQAADELRNLSKRQKGGWLRARLRPVKAATAAPEESAAPRGPTLGRPLFRSTAGTRTCRAVGNSCPHVNASRAPFVRSFPPSRKTAHQPIVPLNSSGPRSARI